jgi:hypothetical protein
LRRRCETVHEEKFGHLECQLREDKFRLERLGRFHGGEYKDASLMGVITRCQLGEKREDFVAFSIKNVESSNITVVSHFAVFIRKINGDLA